jgi:hypothetical protein
MFASSFRHIPGAVLIVNILYKRFGKKCYQPLIHTVSAHFLLRVVESSWNAMAHGDALEGKWRGNWRMEWVASILHTTTEHGVSSFTTADAHTSATSCRLNWRPLRFKLTRPLRRKTKSGFCACAITFQTQSTTITKWNQYIATKHCLLVQCSPCTLPADRNNV